MFERFINVMYVIYDFYCVVVGGLLNFMSCKHLLHSYVLSSTSCPCEFFSVTDGFDNV